MKLKPEAFLMKNKALCRKEYRKLLEVGDKEKKMNWDYTHFRTIMTWRWNTCIGSDVGSSRT